MTAYHPHIESINFGTIGHELAISGKLDDFLILENSFYVFLGLHLDYQIYKVGKGYQSLSKLGGFKNTSHTFVVGQSVKTLEESVEWVHSLY